MTTPPRSGDLVWFRVGGPLERGTVSYTAWCGSTFFGWVIDDRGRHVAMMPFRDVAPEQLNPGSWTWREED